MPVYGPQPPDFASPVFITADEKTWCENVENVPDFVQFSIELLENADLSVLRIDRGCVDIKCENGRWVYELFEYDEEKEVWWGRLRYREESYASIPVVR